MSVEHLHKTHKEHIDFIAKWWNKKNVKLKVTFIKLKPCTLWITEVTQL